ncbi:hypothetical protein CEXT_371151 [Caerostris extrusa]|uniref:Uncharacterized protein n=1 Tax=Caerostris extrusa TaxID=172846 RepID=A0AAV4N9E4_CAEEX|nr:hypothetical protein CEXT_371151 [Caerostris extrusa]
MMIKKKKIFYFIFYLRAEQYLRREKTHFLQLPSTTCESHDRKGRSPLAACCNDLPPPYIVSLYKQPSLADLVRIFDRGFVKCVEFKKRVHRD